MSGLLAFILAPAILSLASTFLNTYFAEKGVGGVLTDSKNSTLTAEGDKI